VKWLRARRHPRWVIAGGTAVCLLAWIALAIAGSVLGWWHRSLAPAGDTSAFAGAARHLIDTRNSGNVAFCLIEGGAARDPYFVSIGEAVGPDTLFQVASLSKWLTAWSVMTLVESGAVDLDAPVQRYLTRWHLPDGEFDNDQVTVRRLLSHTAGLTDGLGFAGYAPGVELPTLEAALNHPNASAGHSGVIRVGAEPGAGWKYSGGGYLILQLLVEEVTQEPFEGYMQRAIFGPLGMRRSAFTVDASTPDIATFYDVDGTPAIHYQFRAKAAASLYTSVTDLTRFVQAHFTGPQGEPAGRGVLRPETLVQMRQPQPHADTYGADIWGLGVMLFAPVGQSDFVIGHDGSNDPAINTSARLNPTNGDGIIVLETGDPSLASTLAGEWVFWQTGTPDFIMLALGAGSMVRMVVVGCLAIVLLGVVLGWRVTRSTAT
jgi:CubicO group peptidase (beta-lactamase class C family)